MQFKKYIFLIILFFKTGAISENYKKISNLGLHEKKQIAQRIQGIEKIVQYLQAIIDAALKKTENNASWTDKLRIELLVKKQVDLQLEALELKVLSESRI